jgi:uncharacterized delta-60 repeat protein
MRRVYLQLLILFATNCLAQGYDETFNATGMVFPPYANQPTGSSWPSASTNTILLRPNGKIVTHGSQNDNGTGTVLRQYNIDGSLDASFGTSGTSFIPGTTSPNILYFPGCKLLDDGKILLIVYRSPSTGSPFIGLRRLNANGTVDTTFGTNGYIEVPNVPVGETDYLQQYFFSADGHITIVSRKLYIYQNMGRHLPIIIRLKPDYSLDAGFGSSGIFIPDELDYSQLNGPRPLMLLEDGSIIINIGSYPGKKVIRVTPQGTLDMMFGPGAIRTFDNTLYNLCKVANGKFWGAGSDGGTTPWEITRYNPDLTVDISFGTNGSVPGSFGESVLQPDNKLVTLQNSSSGGFIISHAASIKRYNEDGSVELTRQFLFQNNTSKEGKDIALQSDGKVLICGSYWYAGSPYPYLTAPFLIRLLPDLNLPELGLPDVDNGSLRAVVYPNPVNNVINLTYNLTISENVSVALYDVQGRLIKGLVKMQAAGDVVMEIELPGNLASGQYFLKIATFSGITKTVKIVKN